MEEPDKNVILKAAETLMEQYGNTNARDVKNRLKKQGFKVFKADMIQHLENISQEEGWQTSQSRVNQETVYQFGADSQESLEVYLEKESNFWEIRVEGKRVLENEGPLGKNGTYHQENWPRNQKALRIARRRIQAKKDAGFREAQDARLAYPLRQRYGGQLDENILACHLTYHSLAAQEIEMPPNNQSLKNKKSLGLQFSCSDKTAFPQLRRLLAAPEWTYPQIGIDLAQILGEKTFSTEPCSPDQASGLGAFSEKLSIQVLRSHLVHIDLELENGQILHLSKFELDTTSEILPLAQYFLV